MNRSPSPHSPGATPATAPRPTLDELTALPPTLDVETAAWLLGIGRTTAYQLAARNALPVPVLRIGRMLRIPTAPLLALLGMTAPDTTTTTSSSSGADGGAGPGRRTTPPGPESGATDPTGGAQHGYPARHQEPS